MTSDATQVRDGSPRHGVKAHAQDVPPGYKWTDAGVIPADWSPLSVADVARVKGGKRLPAGFTLADDPTPYPYVRVSDMYPGGVDVSALKYVPEAAFPPIRNYRIYADEIFISVAGTLGIVGIVPKEISGANLTENADRLTNLRCERDYLKYWLMSRPIQDAIESIRTVGAQPKLALGRIARFEIALPPRCEQGAIAEALSDVDGLLGALDALIAKKRAIKQAAMQQLLAGKTRLPGFSGEWAELNMAADSILKARIGWQGLTTSEYLSTGEYYLVTGTDFVNGRIDWTTCHFVNRERFVQDRNIQLNARDVLVTKDGTIGKAGYVETLPGPATLNSGVFVIRPTNDAYMPLYMYYVLTSRIFDRFLARLQAGSTITHLYQKDFVGFAFDAPSREEQAAIATALSEMDAEIAALEARRDKTRAIKQGMMQQLLTGRVRLVKPEAAA